MKRALSDRLSLSLASSSTSLSRDRPRRWRKVNVGKSVFARSNSPRAATTSPWTAHRSRGLAPPLTVSPRSHDVRDRISRDRGRGDDDDDDDISSDIVREKKTPTIRKAIAGRKKRALDRALSQPA